ncbi:hypothetical protein [Actinomadura madurae]|uniref:hypothetical protein n=1 Tax=Actinomadura madurae TaxID=1993 RepID=UPI002026B65E|nr:hypothetical protein [Actinomadura madurae]MCP9952114.1 hypothetical protein [Actinomadura madurae]MCQ0007141.1 hypothetical protein [Actinomadura madurae]URM97645.1 hypothetical protein LUW76_26595 [Actinomadura madurae]URN08334.1 hypothetical protein LUW74_36480 [Actinomadura madurae]
MDRLTRGLAAGAAGTTALNLVTYLDMAVRGRPASSTPEQSVERLADVAGVDLGEGEQADNRKAGLGPILGFGTGLGAGLLFGLVAGRRRVPRPVGAVALTGLAMLGSSAPMTLLGLTDPREWTASDWAADVIPHLAYGAVAAGVYDALR